MTDTIQSDVLTEQTTPQEKKKKKGFGWGSLIIWTAVIGLLALLGWGLLKSNAPRPEAGQTAPNFTMEFFEGYEWNDQPTATLEEMQGNVVVLNFWASWCVECRYEADVLDSTARQYADDGVVFVGLAYADVEPNSLQYMQEFDVSYPHAPDLGTAVSNTYEITGVPETFIIDQNGEIAYVHIGPIDQATLNGVISRLLQEGG